MRMSEDELKAASEIQEVLLPSSSPQLRDYDLAAANLPAKIVSGDYYDFIRIDRDHTGVVIADVSGKGIPASLVMATCRSLLRMSARGALSPSGALKKVNRIIFPDIREDMFISLAYLILDLHSDEVILARAGHDPPMVYRKSSNTVECIKSPGMALGIDSGRAFDRVTQNASISMQPGDCILLYTDGVNEALDSSGINEFGLDRLQQEFLKAASSGKDARAVIDHIIRCVEEFMGASAQSDDITLVAIEKL